MHEILPSLTFFQGKCLLKEIQVFQMYIEVIKLLNISSGNRQIFMNST